MRVITGSARGMSLKTLEGESTRPTSEKVKEAVFSAIQFEIEGRSVLDLFAGSGQLGIEALSRGAAYACFVDSGKQAIGIIRSNVEKTGFTASSRICQMDYLGFLRMNTQKFDIVFLDPPYQSDMLLKSLAEVGAFVNPGGSVIAEHPSEVTLQDEFGELKKYRSYKYGKTSVTIFRKG